MYECMSSHLTCTHHISILHTHVNVFILPDQAEVVKKGFQMKVRQSSGAGKIVFRAVKNFNNIPHILEIRVFSFTRFLKFPFIVFGGCSSLRFFCVVVTSGGCKCLCMSLGLGTCGGSGWPPPSGSCCYWLIATPMSIAGETNLSRRFELTGNHLHYQFRYSGVL